VQPFIRPDRWRTTEIPGRLVTNDIHDVPRSTRCQQPSDSSFVSELPLGDDISCWFLGRRHATPSVHSRPAKVHSRPTAVHPRQPNVHLGFGCPFGSAGLQI